MEIRSARSDELAELLALAVAFYAEDGFATAPAELAGNLTILLERDDARVAVAVEAAALLGFAITTVGFGLEHGSIAELEDLYVAPASRRRGVGGALVEDSARWARQVGSRFLELVVAPNGQDVGHLFGYYAGLGFADEGRRLLSLPVDGAALAGF
jgi:aminoglycoside 6'-N-acetyltransferase I